MTTSGVSIADLGFLSDCRSAALVDRGGSVDWWCPDRFDSSSVFARLLGPAAGHWSLGPVGPATTTREYVDGTLVLRTEHRTDQGSVAVTDCLALEPGARGHEIGKGSPAVLLRRVEGLTGSVAMRSEVAARPEYGRTEAHLRTTGDGFEAWGGTARLLLTGVTGWQLHDGVARLDLTVTSGDVVEMRLAWHPSFGASADGRPIGSIGMPSVDDTVAAWRSWSAQHRSYDGPFAAEVRHGSLVLQGLTYARSGAVVAAATTSLPEVMGGDANWDYRFAWLRDLSLTARALWVGACPDEPERLFEWLAASAGHIRDELVQIAYGVGGERDLTERELTHLPGFRDSRPVRAGNAAWQQVQLDVLGEVLDAAHLLRDAIGAWSPAVVDLLVALADRAADAWQDPDAGMWEARDAERHYTSSKVMCWVALDRAVALAPRLGGRADPARWGKVRDEIREAVLADAWSPRLGAYAGAFGSDEPDASVLLLPLVGFVPADDERMSATIDVIATRLGGHGLVKRWESDPSGFLICTFWLVECLAMRGERGRAEDLFRLAASHANDLGIMAEEADLSTGEPLGNVPQAFSHVGLINAAWRLAASHG